MPPAHCHCLDWPSASATVRIEPGGLMPPRRPIMTSAIRIGTPMAKAQTR